MEAKIFELANGLRVVYKAIPYTRAVHCGYVINSGSRDDLAGEQGMAHFIEHMIFKGTIKRKTFHVLNYLESVGGDVNAYTTKEKTCLYASIAAEYFERATEYLTDITFHSIFPPKELKKEQQVIAEEIEMYRNIPDEAIFEDFEELVFPDHTLGQPILGTKSSISRFTQDRILDHIRNSFVQNKVVFSIVGNVTEKQVKRIINKHLKPLEIPAGGLLRESPEARQVLEKQVPIPSNQVHEIIGGRAYAMRKDLYLPFLLLNNLLGGPAMNSRLNLNIREKHGLSYNINSFYSPYLDTGVWGIYYACELKNLERIRKLVQKEMRQFIERPLTDMRLNQAKKQFRGQLILGSENLLGQMLGMAQDILDFDHLISFSDYLTQIDKISTQEVWDAAQEIFKESPISRITYLQQA